jgi:hypothetical protein
MINILEIYKKYQIMLQLQEHQFKVAAVASLICENYITPQPPLILRGGDIIDRENIIAACLLHDMGNIVKFNLNETQNLLNQNINLGYWQRVKDKYIQKYGAEAHRASILIAKELGMSGRIIALIDCISFSGAPQDVKAGDFGKKIVQYSDDRVAPQGVVSLEDRLADLRKRYVHHKIDSSERDNFENALREMERQIFAKCKIKPEDITEAAIRPYIERLKNYKI